MLSEVHQLPPVEDVKAPETLVAEDDLQVLLAEHKPQFVPVLGREDEGTHPPPDAAAGVVQRRLSNGCTLNYKVSDNDPSSAGMRLCMSGGRAAEVTSGAGPSGVGAMQIGLRTSAPPPSALLSGALQCPVCTWRQPVHAFENLMCHSSACVKWCSSRSSHHVARAWQGWITELCSAEARALIAFRL